MFELLEKLHKKPEGKRRIYATSISLGITLVIFIVWLSVIFPGSVKEEVSDNRDNRWKESIATPFEAFKKNTSQATAALKDQLNIIKEAIKIGPEVYNAETATGTPDANYSANSASKTDDSEVGNESETMVY